MDGFKMKHQCVCMKSSFWMAGLHYSVLPHSLQSQVCLETGYDVVGCTKIWLSSFGCLTQRKSYTNKIYILGLNIFLKICRYNKPEAACWRNHFIVDQLSCCITLHNELASWISLLSYEMESALCDYSDGQWTLMGPWGEDTAISEN